PSWGARIDMWKVALVGFAQKPFFGWGPEALPKILSACPDILKWYHGVKTWDFHNDFFNMLATGGVLLVGSYVAMMSAFAWIVRKNIGAFWAVINLLVLGCSNVAFRGRAIAFSFYLVYLLFLLCSDNKIGRIKEI
ncbi:MAG: O-antigen ligase family protein, partial [Duodenibacillus sp.]|nr:O-antigen ligase family protein [Duodenibacillus sp.]